MEPLKSSTIFDGTKESRHGAAVLSASCLPSTIRVAKLWHGIKGKLWEKQWGNIWEHHVLMQIYSGNIRPIMDNNGTYKQETMELECGKPNAIGTIPNTTRNGWDFNRR